MNGLFVIGTDTGVGKTLVSTALLRAWSSTGRRVAAMKPCETGDGDDAVRLLSATGRALDPALVNPYRYTLPAAPSISASREGKRIDLEVISRSLATLASDAERVLVEGAGGLLVPFTDDQTTAHLVVRLGLPVLVVARTGLGTINHTLLTLEALSTRAIRVLGVVFSQGTPVAGAEEAESVRYLVGRGVRCLGVVPFLDSPSPEGRERACATHLELEEIWSATGT